MYFKAEVEVSTRDGVLNPESKAILNALQTHNFPILELKVTKKFYINLESNSKYEAMKLLQVACNDLLSNPVVQDYSINILDEGVK